MSSAKYRGMCGFRTLKTPRSRVPLWGLRQVKHDDRAHAGLRQEPGFDLHGEAFQFRAQLLANDRLDAVRVHVVDTVFQFRKRLAQGGTEVPVARQHLSEFLQAGDLGNQPQQARLRAGVRRQFDLFQQLDGEARVREVANHEQHGLAHRLAPCRIRFWNQVLDRDEVIDDPSAHLVP